MSLSGIICDKTNKNRVLERFLASHPKNAAKAEEKCNFYLQWRRAQNMDKIREGILLQGTSNPTQFPHGKKILKAFPLLLAAFSGLKLTFNIITSSKFGYNTQFSNKGVMVDEYFSFILHVAEYQTMVLQLTYDSHSLVTVIPTNALNKDFGGTGRFPFVFNQRCPGPFLSEKLLVDLPDPQQLKTRPVSILRQKSTASSTSSSSETVQKRPKLLSRKSILRVFGFNTTATSTVTRASSSRTATSSEGGSDKTTPPATLDDSVSVSEGGESEAQSRRKSIKFV